MIIGIIGPADSISKILSIKNELENSISLLPLKAHTLQETKDVISKINFKIDGLLFTGRSVYDSVKFIIPSNIPFEFVPHNESSIFSVLMQNKLENVNKISIDVIEKDIVEDSLKESKIKFFNCFPHKDGNTELDYINFHENNIVNKKTDAIFTTFSPIYEHFKNKNIPVYRLYTTKFAVRNSLNQLINKIKNQIIDKAKISVQIILVAFDKKNISKFDLLNKSLQFQKSLVSYLKTIQGSIFNNSYDEFIIFSTKGFIANQNSRNEFHKILNKQRYNIYSGVGIGLTASEAENNATCALEYAKQTNKSCFYFMYENKNIEGPIQAENCLVLNKKNSNLNIDEVYQKTGLSYNYIDRLIAIISLYKTDEFLSDELATYLGITNRSSRRILKKLIDSGYANIVGKEIKSGSGRPKNKIKLLLK